MRRRDMRRRDFLDASAAAALAGFLPRAVSAEPEDLIQYTQKPQNLATPTLYFDRLITPTSVFFVRSHFGPPALDPSRRLRVSGLVERALDLGREELEGFKEVTITAVLQCSGNSRSLYKPRVPGVQWGHGAMGQASFTGVRLAEVLKAAGLKEGAAHVRLQGADTPPKPMLPAFKRSLPLARALDPSTLLCYRMNGEPLSLAHGAPLRLVVPGWAGDHWVKWLTHLELHRDPAEGFYYREAYRIPKEPGKPGLEVDPEKTIPITTLPVRSLIGRPVDGERLKVGKQEIVGVAFSGDAAIGSVEISLDGGKQWAKAKLTGEPGPGRWQVFRHAFEAKTPGTLTAMARATDDKGRTQPQEPTWNPGGYLWNGIHTISFTVIP